jgi:hypothetical protein
MMSFFTANSNDCKVANGIVYILYMTVDGELTVKIGVTTKKVEERVCQILTSYWKSYRIFPETYPKRFSKTTFPFDKEAALHKYFEKYSHKFDKRFDGFSEFFSGISEEELLQVYKDCLNEVDINSEEYICSLEPVEKTSET